jgi:hypothetical protein
MKLASPGVSTRCRPCFFQGSVANPVDSDFCRVTSSGSKSVTVEPDCTLPSVLIAPAVKRRASQRLVFPQALCPMTARFLRSFVAISFIVALLSNALHAAARARGPGL